MTMKEYQFGVAGFRLVLRLPEAWDAGALLPSFRPFRRTVAGGCEMLADCTVEPSDSTRLAEPAGVLLEESSNDLGHIRLYRLADRYVVTVSMHPDSPVHLMEASRDFSRLRIFLSREDRDAGRMLSSLLRIAYSQAVLFHGAVSVHASAVYRRGKAYLFLGKSGTGKSTHSSLWLGHLSGTGLLNDDNPTVRLIGGRAYAWGTPWSGKTPCYKDLYYPVGGMVRLSQSPCNRFCLLEGTDAFAALLPGCSVIRRDAALCGSLYDTLAFLSGMVPVGILECRPDREAALLCESALSEAQIC